MRWEDYMTETECMKGAVEVGGRWRVVKGAANRGQCEGNQEKG